MLKKNRTIACIIFYIFFGGGQKSLLNIKLPIKVLNHIFTDIYFFQNHVSPCQNVHANLQNSEYNQSKSRLDLLAIKRILKDKDDFYKKCKT